MKSQRTGIQGELGAFSQEAAGQLLGSKAEVVPYPTFESVFIALRGGKINSAVIPMENTLAGSVHENYDHLLHFDVRIAAETNVRIVHNLIAPPGVRFKDLRKVYSHPVALNQCHKFFARYPKLERVPFYDTAGSVKMVMEKKRAMPPPSPPMWPPPFTAAPFSSVQLRTTGEISRASFCCIRPRNCPRPGGPRNGKLRWFLLRATFQALCSAV